MSLSTAIVASAAMEEGQAAPAKPARQTPALWLPRVDSLAEFGLMISRQLTQCRRYGGHLSVLWLEAAPAGAGDDATLAALERSAAHVKALDAAHSAAQSPEEAIRALWSQAFDLLLRLTALERAVDDAKTDLADESDFQTLLRLKTERDAVKRLIDSGGWTDPAQVSQVLH